MHGNAFSHSSRPSRARQVILRDGVGKLQFCEGFASALHWPELILASAADMSGVIGPREKFSIVKLERSGNGGTALPQRPDDLRHAAHTLPVFPHTESFVRANFRWDSRSRHDTSLFFAAM